MLFDRRKKSFAWKLGALEECEGVEELGLARGGYWLIMCKRILVANLTARAWWNGRRSGPFTRTPQLPTKGAELDDRLASILKPLVPTPECEGVDGAICGVSIAIKT